MTPLPQSLVDAVKPVPVERDEDGWFNHPADKHLNPEGEEIAYGPLFHAMNLQVSAALMENEIDEDHPAYIAYFDNAEAQCRAWDPEKPDGDGWFLFSIHDTEDGPAAFWLRLKVTA